MIPANADTIAACATTLTPGARAMIRVSGPGVRALSAVRLGLDRFERGCVVTRLTLGMHSLRVTAICYEGPASFTGEDVLEIILPGNPILIERVLGSLEGVRPAGPGEFSARAYLNAKLTLEQAEGVAHSITAESDAELAVASDLLAGRRGGMYRGWTDRLATLLALTEAGIDFTDQEDVVVIRPEALVEGLVAIRGELASELGASVGSAAREALPRVALVGAPSAGKSTLFNALLGERRSVTHASPGTTRDVIAERLVVDRSAVELLDLPGLDADARGLDARSQDAAMKAAHDADLRLYCDPTGRFDRPFPAPTIRVRTKADLGPPENAGFADLSVSAVEGVHLPSLCRAIADHATVQAPGVPPRHAAAFRVAHEHLSTAIARGTPDEVTAGAMRAALDALASLTGDVSPDDVIGRIFASFCVGK